MRRRTNRDGLRASDPENTWWLKGGNRMSFIVQFTRSFEYIAKIAAARYDGIASDSPARCSLGCTLARHGVGMTLLAFIACSDTYETLAYNNPSGSTLNDDTAPPESAYDESLSFTNR